MCYRYLIKTTCIFVYLSDSSIHFCLQRKDAKQTSVQSKTSVMAQVLEKKKKQQMSNANNEDDECLEGQNMEERVTSLQLQIKTKDRLMDQLKIQLKDKILLCQKQEKDIDHQRTLIDFLRK